MVVEDAETGFVGAVMRIEYGRMELEDRHGRKKPFPVGPGYLIDGRPVILTPPTGRPASVRAPRLARWPCPTLARRWRSRAVSTSRAATTPNSSNRCGVTTCASRRRRRIPGGVDDLAAIVEEFRPAPGRRLGVLVDHLVAGSKEARIADAVRRGPGGAHTLVVGHPFIDIWQAVKPGRIGVQAWPVIPKGVDWKKGVCSRLGWPHAQQADIARAWQRIRGRVRDWNDLEPELIGRVEELIDFVTSPYRLMVVVSRERGRRSV